MEEGRTFAKKLGQQIMPEFISVIDDPTCEQLQSKTLNGFYKIDDEGVPAQKVTLVDHGVLKTFLCGRSPVKVVHTAMDMGAVPQAINPLPVKAI